MANHQLTDSEIEATFYEIQHLFSRIYAARNVLVVDVDFNFNLLWNKVLHLKFLTKIIQSERNRAIQQQLLPNGVYPFQQFNTAAIPVHGYAGPSISQPAYPAAMQTHPIYPSTQTTQSRPFPAIPPRIHSQPGYLEQYQLLTQQGNQSTNQSQFATFPTVQQFPTQPTNTVSPNSGNPNGQTFTRAQLAQFTGLNGMPAYVAVNGIVYDVTNNAAWSAATHFGLRAGMDLTAEFASCHEGQQWILAQLKAIGRLVG